MREPRYTGVFDKKSDTPPTSDEVHNLHTPPPPRRPKEKEIVYVEKPELTVDDEDNIPAGKFLLTPVGLMMQDDATIEDWRNVGKALGQVTSSIGWNIGDWINTGVTRWGAKYEEAMEITGYTYQTLADYSYVCAQIDFSIRNRKLTLGHSRLVAGKSPEEQKMWIDLAAESGWTVSFMRLAISQDNPNPTPLSKPTRYSVEYFQQEIQSVRNKFQRGLSKVGESERHQLADELRRMADEIEGKK